jgi:ubiquinone/menaquinone biosynthesis C-methylase UbiE
MLPKGGMILDLGCGSGRDSAYFVASGFPVIGIDLSEELLKLAKKNVPQATFFIQDFRKLTFPVDSFDGVWACASLLHLKHQDIPAVFLRIYRVLKPHGIFFLFLKEGVGEEEKNVSSVPYKKRFFSFYKSDELRRYLEKAGFSVLDIYTVQDSKSVPHEPPEIWISCFARKAP